MEARIALVTSPTYDEASRLASKIVEKRLAACVNILPHIHSIYLWEGVKEEATEVLLLIKTQKKHIQKLEAQIKELHSYDTPEYVVMTPEYIEERYLSWLLHSTQKDDET